MTIDTNNGVKPGTPGNSHTSRSATTPNSSVQKSSAQAKTAGRDDVVLSQEAQSLSRLKDNINGLSEVNSERVEEIRQAIADGRFEVDAERIAENMLEQDDLLS